MYNAKEAHKFSVEMKEETCAAYVIRVLEEMIKKAASNAKFEIDVGGSDFGPASAYKEWGFCIEQARDAGEKLVKKTLEEAGYTLIGYKNYNGFLRTTIKW